MIDPATSQRWLYRSLFVGICMVIVFFQILPLSTLPTSVPGPDLLLCLTFAWVHRRPEFVPPLVIALVFLTVDMLTQRPPGLRVALILVHALLRAERVAQAMQARGLAQRLRVPAQPVEAPGLAAGQEWR